MSIDDVNKWLTRIEKSAFYNQETKDIVNKITYNDAYKYLAELITENEGYKSNFNQIKEVGSSEELSVLQQSVFS